MKLFSSFLILRKSLTYNYWQTHSTISQFMISEEDRNLVLSRNARLVYL